MLVALVSSVMSEENNTGSKRAEKIRNAKSLSIKREQEWVGGNANRWIDRI